MPDIPVFFRAPPGGAGDFLLRGQEKVTKEKATPAPRFSTFPGRKVRSTRTGMAHAPSVARGPCERNPLRSPCGPDRPRLTATQGPCFARFLRVHADEANCLASLRTRPGWPSPKRKMRRCMMPRSAAERQSKRRMFEAKEGRVRRGCRSASIAGELRQHDVAETVMPGAMVFGDFLPKPKVTRAPKACETAFGEASATAHGASSTRTAAMPCGGRLSRMSKPSSWFCTATGSALSCDTSSSSATCLASR